VIFELLGQVESAEKMGVSRPTFANIYESARRKVAQAFVQGKSIVFEGGKVYFDSEWYSCNNCGCWFNHPEKEEEVTACALCGSAEIDQYKENTQLIDFVRGCSGNVYTLAEMYLGGKLTDSGISCAQHEHHHGEGHTCGH